MIDLERRFWPLMALCALLIAIILALMPPEKTLGQIIKIVYLHGALSRAGMVGFFAAGATGAVYLLRPRPTLARWTASLMLSGFCFWSAHFLVSIPATRLTWGPWIAWGEPRVTMTLQLAGVGLVIIAISWLLSDARFTAGANALMGIAVAVMAGRTGVLRHPLDPIGGSPSATSRFVYLLLLVPVIASMVLVAWRLQSTRLAATLVSGQTEADPNGGSP